MKKLLFIFFSILSSGVLAQNSILVKNLSFSDICSGQEIEVAFTTTGTFANNNDFKIQISDKSGNNFKDIGLITKSSPIKIKLPDDLVEAFGYQVRVISTNPVVQGIPSNAFKVLNKPKVVLTSTYPNELKYPTNGNQSYSLSIKALNGTPIDIVLSDSSKYTFYSSDNNIYVRPTQSTIYRVASVSNKCGVGESSGTVDVRLNQYAFKIYGLETQNLFCIGGKINFSYSANGAFNSDNKFKLIITSATSTYEKTIDLSPTPNTETGLSGTLPSDLENGKFYQVRLQSSSPALTSPAVGISIPVKPNSSLGLYNQYETPYISANAYGGVPPYKIQYSDGTSYSGTSNFQIPILANSYLKLKTTIEDQCGPIATPKDSVIVSGFPYMSLDSLPTRPICSSENIEITFNSNLVFTSKTKFIVKLSSLRASTVIFSSISIEAQRQGNKLIFKTPQAVGFYSVSVSTTDPFSESTPAQGELELNTKGTSVGLSYENYYNTERLYLNGLFHPYAAKIKIDDDVINLTKSDFEYNVDYRMYYFLLKSTKPSKYTLQSAENGCGTATIATNRSEHSRTVSKTYPKEVIIGNLAKEVYCNDEEISIPFKINGTLNSDETVELHIFPDKNSDYSYKIGSSKTSPLKAKLNNLSYNRNRIILKISNSTISSESRQITFKYKPEVSITASLPDGSPALVGQRIPINIRSNGAFPVYYTLNGKPYTIKEKIYDPNTTYYSYNTLIFPTESQKFELTNIRNECGIGINGQTLEIPVVPTRIFFNDYNAPLSSYACASFPFTFNYKVYGLRSTTKIFAQVSDPTGKNFKDATIIKEGNPMTIIFPKDITEGACKIRLGTTINNISYYSEERDLRIIKKGVATLTAADGTSSVENAGSQTTLKVTFTGGQPWEYSIPNVKSSSYPSIFDKQSTINVSPTKKTTYKISEAENFCGYNEIKGEVTVSVKPSIQILTPTSSPLIACTNQKIELPYKALGDFIGNEEITFIVSSKFNLSNPVTISKVKYNNLGSKLSFTIPNTLPEGNYYVGVLINDQPSTQFTFNTITINTFPSATLSGNTIINEGSSTTINLLTKGTRPMNYELSDGTKGVLNPYDISPITIKPSTTSTYSIKSISNLCGVGSSIGSAKITVNLPAEKYIYVEKLQFVNRCSGVSTSVGFTTKGTFSSSNKFILQISDANGDNFTNISGTESTSTPIKFIFPNNLPEGKNYRFRVVSTDTNFAAEASSTSFEVAIPPTISMKSIKNIIVNQSDYVSIQFDTKGGFPIYANISDDQQKIFSTSLIINETPFIYTYTPMQPYLLRLNSVNNVCGVGTIEGERTIMISNVTANEESSDLELLVYPNPTVNNLILQNKNGFGGNLYVFDSKGNQLNFIIVKPDDESININLGDVPAGTYIIRAENQQTHKTWKIIKQ